VEICIGLEINGYLPAEFWSRCTFTCPAAAMPLVAWPRSCRCGVRTGRDHHRTDLFSA